MNTAKFLVTYTPKSLVKIGEFMSALDLGITGIESNEQLIFSIETKSVVDEAYGAMMLPCVKKGLELNDEIVVHSVAFINI